MTAGDVTVLGPLLLNDNAAIVTALSGVAVVADDINSWAQEGQVWFSIIKAA